MRAKTLSSVTGLISLVALSLVSGNVHGRESCPTAGQSFEEAAATLLRCSSTMDLPPLPAGEAEFKANYAFPAAPISADRPWERIDPREFPEQYLRALLAYGLAGNVEVDWRVESNTSATWCHAPWMHSIREGLRGMTRERSSRPFELHEKQKSQWANWAVGVYNDVACQGLGRVWADPAKPRTKGFRFAEGAYAIKLLFTTAPDEEVPYLANSLAWRAGINGKKSVGTLRLLQVDVAVRDPQVDVITGTGWVFGTFIYRADAPGTSPYDRLVPVGLMWGNDPNLTMDEYQLGGKKVEEGWTNPDVATMFHHLPRHQLGLFGRVNGPVDNPRAGCLACHGRALDLGRALPARDSEAGREWETISPNAPNPGMDDEVRRYFRNLKPTDPFVAGTQPLDYSLQLMKGIEFFRVWVAANHEDRMEETSDVPRFVFEAEKVTPPGPTSTATTAKPFFFSHSVAPSFESGALPFTSRGE